MASHALHACCPAGSFGAYASSQSVFLEPARRSGQNRSKLLNKQSTARRASDVKQWQLRFRKLGTAGAYVLSYHHRKPRWEELAAGLRACGDGLRVASCREAATTLERDVSVSLYVVHVQRHRPRAFLKPKRSNLNLIRSSIVHHGNRCFYVCSPCFLPPVTGESRKDILNVLLLIDRLSSTSL